MPACLNLKNLLFYLGLWYTSLFDIFTLLSPYPIKLTLFFPSNLVSPFYSSIMLSSFTFGFASLFYFNFWIYYWISDRSLFAATLLFEPFLNLFWNLIARKFAVYFFSPPDDDFFELSLKWIDCLRMFDFRISSFYYLSIISPILSS